MGCHAAADTRFAEARDITTTSLDRSVAGPRLEAHQLGRRRDDDGWLFRDVSAAIGPGDRIAVLGPSGAGKTLLLRALARLDPLDEGVVLWHGEAVRGEAIPPFRSRVVYCQQRPALVDGTVEANLQVPFSLHVHRGARYDRQKVVSLLERLGRDAAFLSKSHRDLSGGEAQIAALVRLIQFDPAILLLDEPTASLDRETARAIEELLDGWHAEDPPSRALVWVTHDPEQAQRVASRHWAMHAGRLTTES